MTTSKRRLPLRTLTAAAAAGALLAGAPVQAAEQLEVAWVHSNASAQSEQRAKDGFQAWLENTDRDWSVSYMDSRGSGQRTANNLQDAVERGVDAIILSMADLRASRAAIDAAIREDIPIFTIDSGWVKGVAVDVTTNNWVMGAMVSAHLLNTMGGKGDIIFLRMAEHHGTRKRAATMETILKEYGDINVLEEHNLDYTAFYEDATNTMQDYAARYGDEIDAVWAPWDEPAMAAINVLKANDIDAWVTGVDGHPEAVQMVEDPDSRFLATVAQPFEEMGKFIGRAIVDVVQKDVDPREKWPSHTVYLEAPLITKYGDGQDKS
jgi:ABC-type sugar transport system substrate-binding protein